MMVGLAAGFAAAANNGDAKGLIIRWTMYCTTGYAVYLGVCAYTDSYEWAASAGLFTVILNIKLLHGLDRIFDLIIENLEARIRANTATHVKKD